MSSEYSEPFVSIVTPVYNGGQHIRECIESVLSQTYSNWEYIIADNCSTDATVSIAEEYARKDARIKVVKAGTFLPVMQNWNRALRLISERSVFCKVIHADDIMVSVCLEKMVSVALKSDRIGIVSARRMIGDTESTDWLKEKKVVPGKFICRCNMMWRADLFGSPSTIMLRSDIVRSRDKFYDEDDTHADTTVCFDISRDYDVGFVHEVLTKTRKHEASETSRVSVLNTQQAARYYRLKKYGPEFIEEDKYKERFSEVKKLYYDMLVSRYLFKLFKKKERHTRREFCAYHKKNLEKCGEKLEIRWVMTALFDFFKKKTTSMLKRR